jgi:hypothetical protein
MDNLDPGSLLMPAFSTSPPRKFTAVTKVQIFVTALLFCIISTTYARVFTLTPGRSNISGSLQKLGAKSAYSANIEINGGSGKLTVTSFNDLTGTTASSIRQLLELPPASASGAPVTDVYIISGKSETTRLILIHLPQKQQLLAITITQSNSEYRKSKKQPQHNISDIPAYPGSTPNFTAADKKAKLKICVSSTTVPPEAVSAFYTTTLKSAGWRTFLSDKRGSIPQTITFQHGSSICFIMPLISQSGKTTICIVHKRLSAQ